MGHKREIVGLKRRRGFCALVVTQIQKKKNINL